MIPDSDSDTIFEVMEEIHTLLCDYAYDARRDGVNTLHLLMGLAGAVVETTFLFEDPDVALIALMDRIAQRVGTGPAAGELPKDYLPAPFVMDDHAETGRDVVRHVLKGTLEDPYEFSGIIELLTVQNLLSLEETGIPREESLRVLQEMATRIMVLEVAAQELCDVLIDKKIGEAGWTLADCIGALSGLSGHKVGIGFQTAEGQVDGQKTAKGRARAQEQTFDQVVGVMTREAIRHGLPGGTDWRFGLPANDCRTNPPVELVSGIQPFCEIFFRVDHAWDPVFQATCCAKAAGRMLAVAAGGESPEMSPVIARPLAMSAMTESYRALLWG